MTTSSRAHSQAGNITAWPLVDDGVYPNNSKLPLLLYQKVLRDAEPAELFEHIFKKNSWQGFWQGGIYDFHHYHSTAHEALGVIKGHASLQLGGPHGVLLKVSTGDMLLIPAGIAHRCVRQSEDFAVVAAYPAGQDWDLLCGEADERPAADERILALPLPVRDPIYGNSGPMKQYWA